MATLFHAKESHAKDKATIIDAVLVLFVEEGLSHKGWVLYPLKGGAGSYCLVNPEKTKEFHFRNGGKGCLAVYDDYYWNSKGLAPVAMFCNSHQDNPDDVQRMRVKVRRWMREIS